MNTRRKLAALLATAGLMVGMLASAGSVAASSSFGWAGNGWPNDTCSESSETMLWIFTGGDGISNVVFHSPSSDDPATMSQPGGSHSAWKVTVAYFDPTGLTGSDIYVTYDGSLAKHAVLTLSHCDGTATGSSVITSQVKDGEGVTLDNDQNPGIAPVTAHDTAQITFTGPTDLPDGSTVQFYFWNNIDCSGEPADSSDQMDVSGTSPANVDGSAFSQGPLGAGEYSFQAVFTSGDEAVLDSATGDCEPFVVLTASSSGTTETTLPPTSEFGDTSNPTDHSWILIAALGMILGSLLVLTPARARNKR